MRNRRYRFGVLTGYVFANNFVALQAALSGGADPNELDSDGRTPLIHAVIDNQLEIARLLVESGAQIDVRDYRGTTALHVAAQNQNLEMASLLLHHGAPIDAEDGDGNTPLSTAVFNSKGHGDLISALLSAGADRDHQNKHGVSPLELAKSIANYNITQYF